MPEPGHLEERVGVVIIGRNEGERLRRCLESALGQARRLVYVDSGSTDGSRELARGLGAEVIELDLSQPFTAARARNAGWRRLVQLQPDLLSVQFVDGDCELDRGWIAAACQYLERNASTAVACGRTRELHPEASVYNRLCDVEWNAPPGPSLTCGGNALMRLSALAAAEGFNERLIAGEEPELCLRLRRAGWGIERLPDEMVRHDAAMRSFGQWWTRCRRAGYAFASGHALHGAGAERHGAAEVRSILLWGVALPLLTLGLALVHPLGLLLLVAYPAQVLRLRSRFRREGTIPAADCVPYALHCVGCKFPNLLGWLGFQRDRLLARPGRLIEHK